MRKIIVLVSDEKYMIHTKYLFSHIKRDTNYTGDLCLITYDDCETTDFQVRGIIVKKFPRIDPFFNKLNIFDIFFKKWDKILYLDCDTMVVNNDLESLFNINDSLLLCEPEPWTVDQYFNPISDQSLFRDLCNKYNVKKIGFNSGSMLFKSDLIELTTKEDLFNIKEQFQNINHHTRVEGGDQPIFNLKFLDIWEPFPNNEICFWMPEMSGYSRYIVDGVDYKYENQPNSNNIIVKHFVHDYAPWLNHNISHNGKRYFDIYNENILKFNE